MCSLNAGRRCSAHCNSDNFSCTRSAKPSSSFNTKKICATKQNVHVSQLSYSEIYVCVYFKCHIFNAQAVVRLVNLLICIFSYFNNIFSVSHSHTHTCRDVFLTWPPSKEIFLELFSPKWCATRKMRWLICVRCVLAKSLQTWIVSYFVKGCPKVLTLLVLHSFLGW